jgi:hypothetical protein
MSPPRTAARKATFVSSSPREGTDDRRTPVKGQNPLSPRPALLNPHSLSISVLLVSPALFNTQAPQLRLSAFGQELPAGSCSSGMQSRTSRTLCSRFRWSILLVFRRRSCPCSDFDVAVAGLSRALSLTVRYYWFDVVRFRSETYTLVKRKHERGLTIGFVCIVVVVFSVMAVLLFC